MPFGRIGIPCRLERLIGTLACPSDRCTPGGAVRFSEAGKESYEGVVCGLFDPFLERRQQYLAPAALEYFGVGNDVSDQPIPFGHGTDATALHALPRLLPFRA